MSAEKIEAGETLRPGLVWRNLDDGKLYNYPETPPPALKARFEQKPVGVWYKQSEAAQQDVRCEQS